MDKRILYGISALVVVLVIYFVYTQFFQTQSYERFDGYTDSLKFKDQSFVPNSSPAPVAQPSLIDVIKNDLPSMGGRSEQLTANDLLPQDFSSTWAKCNPSGAGNLEGQNFLDAGFHMGIDTVGQTLRNANLQLRSEYPNPQIVVSPFNQTTIMPDTNRRYFEVGQC